MILSLRGFPPGPPGHLSTRWAGIVRISAPPIASNAAKKYRLADVLCVRSVIQPTRKVLAKPAMLPSELISAIPAAAAAPPRNAAGKVQNDDCAVDAPAVAKTRPAIASSVLLTAQAVRSRPQAVTMAGISVCQRRSRT